MQMILRWYGKDEDHITLEQIRQIPGVTGVATALHHIPVGEVWPIEEIMAVKQYVESYGLKIEAIESVNVHEDIKLGLPSRDKYIENYKETIHNLGKCGIKVLCYNFMPVFDWIRTQLAEKLDDNSTVLSYDEAIMQKINPDMLFQMMNEQSNGFSLAGWEKERLENTVKPLIEQYIEMGKEKLWENLEYFLKAIIPIAEKYDVKMAIHPDDPPWDIFGLPRIVTSKEDLERITSLVNSPYNGLTICTGSLGANIKNDIPEIIRCFGERNRLNFAHLRNIKIEDTKFWETSHRTEDGSLDMFEIVKACSDIGFDGPVRPDHGRMIWGEKGRPGYGLYDRALGAVYLNGLKEAIERMKLS